jgi:hypothetical protein
MSIYRTIDGLKPGSIQTDMVTQNVVESGLPKPEPDRLDPIQAPDWSSKRRAAPVDELMKGTLRWATTLPAELRPQALMNKFPRVANLVAACWKEPKSFHICMNDLVVVIDRRGKRQGFPPEVLIELVNLQTYNYLNRYGPMLAQQPASEPDDKGPLA